MSGAVPLLFLNAFMVVTGIFLLFTFPAKYEESHFITTEISRIKLLGIRSSP